MLARCLVALVALQTVAVADTYEQRIASESKQLQTALEKHCPDRKAEIAKLPALDAAGLARLAPCGKTEPLYHQTLGSVYLNTGDFPAAEASFRKSLSFGVTESGQAGLLMALVRQPKLGKAQQADVKKQLGYFRAHPCTRDDICVGVAYAAWHLEDIELTRSSGDAAIALGFTDWQPYFFSGAAYAVEPNADRKKARKLLLEAKKRGAPADVDDLLRALPAP